MIWRRLRVHANTSFADLHNIIQICMGWDDDYLHSFHIYGEDYGVSRVGGMHFNHDAHDVFISEFGFDTGDRFEYTYNFNQYWLCDIRVESIEQSTKRAPWCLSGSGRQGDARYYKADENSILFDVIGTVVNANESAAVEDIRTLIEHYEAIRFHRPSINAQLREKLSS
jgi:hypothetical protein